MWLFRRQCLASTQTFRGGPSSWFDVWQICCAEEGAYDVYSDTPYDTELALLRTWVLFRLIWFILLLLTRYTTYYRDLVTEEGVGWSGEEVSSYHYGNISDQWRCAPPPPCISNTPPCEIATCTRKSILPCYFSYITLVFQVTLLIPLFPLFLVFLFFFLSYISFNL